MSKFKSIAYRLPRMPAAEMQQRADAFFSLMAQRRSVRHFSADPVSRDLIEQAIAAANTSPSGANRQPWRFVVVSDAETKQAIRLAAEAEERESYGGRMSQEWLEALEPLGTDWQKPFLEVVPWIVVIFEETYGIRPDGTHRKNYYVKESVGMATGLLIAALHNMGLATLTHTPSPMRFLSDLLQRPANEKPYVMIPIGFPAKECEVPMLERKAISDLVTWV